MPWFAVVEDEHQAQLMRFGSASAPRTIPLSRAAPAEAAPALAAASPEPPPPARVDALDADETPALWPWMIVVGASVGLTSAAVVAAVILANQPSAASPILFDVDVSTASGRP